MSMHRVIPITAVLALFVIPSCSTQRPSGAAQRRVEAGLGAAPCSDAYVRLRAQILAWKRSEHPGMATPPGVRTWAVVVEQTSPNYCQAFVCHASGRAEVFDETQPDLSGAIGNIGALVSQLVSQAEQLRTTIAATRQNPGRATPRLTFYLLTDDGVVSDGASIADLRIGRHRLAGLFKL
jgi:hypothetical protein